MSKAVILFAVLLFSIIYPGNVYSNVEKLNLISMEYDLKLSREIAIITSGAAIYGANFFVRYNYPHESAYDYGRNNLNIDNVNIFDRWAANPYSDSVSFASTILLNTVVVFPLFFLFDDSISNALTYLVMYGEVMLLSNSVKDMVKSAVTRYRPYAYFSSSDDDLMEKKDSSESFFSGHTSTAFSAAAFISAVYFKMHPERTAKYWVSIGAYSAAAATGILRICAGMHFPTDIIVGAAWGTFIGIFIPKIHEIKKTGKKESNLLLFSTGAGNINLQIRF